MMSREVLVFAACCALAAAHNVGGEGGEVASTDGVSILAKHIIALCFLLFGCIAAAALPIWMLHYWKEQPIMMKVFGVINCFAGGVILGSALNHMLPGSQSAFEAVADAQFWSPGMKAFSWTGLVMGGVLLLLIFVEMGFHAWAHSRGGGHEHGVDGESHHGHSHDIPADLQHHSDEDEESEQESSSAESGYSNLSKKSSKSNKSAKGSKVGHGRKDVSAIKAAESDASSQRVTMYAFLAALAVHSIFEGLGIGANRNGVQLNATITALVIHKMLEGFALGLSIHRARMPGWIAATIIVGWSIVAPIGVAIGMALTAGGDAAENNLASAVLQAASAGAMVYVAVVEVIPAELFKHGQFIFKVIACILGWAALVLAALA